MDDLLIYGKSLQEHDAVLKKVMEVAQRNGVTFNWHKIQYRMPEVKYLGYLQTRNGKKITEQRTRAIEEMPSPADKRQLASFLGAANYVREHVPNLAELTAPLLPLLKKNVHYVWTSEHEKVAQQIKKEIA